jgi:hypothetical protein
VGYNKGVPGAVPNNPAFREAPVTLFPGVAMLRITFCAAALLGLCVSLSLADEIRAVITKVEGNKVTFAETKGKGEKGESRTLTAADNVKVVKGTYNKDTKKLEAGDAIAEGLKGEPFSNIGEKGVRATVITDGDKITEIRVGGGRKKNQ